MLTISEEVIERFWSHVVKSDGCWIWTAGTYKHGGYGLISIGDRNHRTHRVAWILANGEIPEGLFVCHHCDNPPCVRPDHLFLGTNLDNMRDSNQKGRLTKGSCRRGHALTPENSVLRNNRQGSYRVCRTCEQAKWRRKYYKSIGKAPPEEG